MDDHFPVKKSQAFLLENVPIFIKNSKNEFVLYKSENIKLDSTKYNDDNLPDLFIRKTDKESALSEIQKALNIELYNQIRSKGLYNVKTILNELVNEALSNPFDGGLEFLPETIELLFQGYSSDAQFLKNLADISSKNHSARCLSSKTRF